MKSGIRASVIANFLRSRLHGNDLLLTGPSSLRHVAPSTLTFAASFTESAASQLNAARDVLVIASKEYRGRLDVPHIIHQAPKLAFVRACAVFFPLPEVRRALGSRISSAAAISEDVHIGHGVVIESDVHVGPGTRIDHNTVLGRGVVIGRNCYVKSGAVIGLRGFGFVRDEFGDALDFPHYRSVRIGDNVEIGAVSTVVAGALDDTILEDGVKINDHVHIAHNARVGRRTMVAAGAVIGGSSSVGSDCWIGMNASLRDGISIGDRVTVGMSAVVTKSFRSDVTIVGCPARVVTDS